MTGRNIALLCLASAISGAALTRVYWQKETLKTEVQTQTVTKDHIVTVIKREKTATGTRTEITRTEDKDVKKDKKATTEVTKMAAPASWRVSLGLDLQQRPIGVIEYRVLGPVHVGLVGSSSGTLGAVVGVEF